MQGLVRKIGFYMQYLTVELLINGCFMKNPSAYITLHVHTGLNILPVQLQSTLIYAIC